jgi:hypothetical protein
MLKKFFKVSAALAAIFLITVTVMEQSAYARIGGGRSFGGRGSRSFSRPSAPSSPSSQPSRSYTQPYTSQPGGGLLRNLGMGMAGGFLGSMLFRGLGYGSTGWGGEGGGGVGPLEILIIGGLGLMLYRMYKRRKEGSGSPFSLNSGGIFGGNTNDSNNRESDLSNIKMSDPSFDENHFNDNVMDMFFKIQAAWMNRDLSSAKSLLTDEMRNIFQDDIDVMLDSKKINRLENIAVRKVEISEAWQESGQDYITTLIYANILDYTIDEQSGDVVSGSKTDPTKFEEFWTFTRPSRSNQWMLSAINQV